MTDKEIEDFYDTLTGELLNSPWEGKVENFFAEGSCCDRLYSQVYYAKQAVMEKLGQWNEDPDLELIIQNLFEIARIQAYRMFRYGESLSKE